MFDRHYDDSIIVLSGDEQDALVRLFMVQRSLVILQLWLDLYSSVNPCEISNWLLYNVWNEAFEGPASVSLMISVFCSCNCLGRVVLADDHEDQ